MLESTYKAPFLKYDHFRQHNELPNLLNTTHYRIFSFQSRPSAQRSTLCSMRPLENSDPINLSSLWTPNYLQRTYSNVMTSKHHLLDFSCVLFQQLICFHAYFASAQWVYFEKLITLRTANNNFLLLFFSILQTPKTNDHWNKLANLHGVL